MSDNASPARPLVLLTRPRESSERFAADLRAGLGPVPIDIAILPLMEIVPCAQDIDLDGVAALIFTSAAGVESFARVSADRELPAWCVGERTAQAARAIGLEAVSAGGDAAALLALLGRVRPAGRLLHLHGIHTRGDVANRLTQAGLEAGAQAIYDQHRLAPGAGLAAVLDHAGPVITPLFSPRSAQLLVDAVGPEAPRLVPVALSAAVRSALPDALAARAVVADSPDAPAMIRGIRGLISA